MPTNDVCNNAIAYLKPMEKGPRPAISLSREDTPVLQVINDDLLVGYLVDSSDHFIYVQHRHLDQEHV